MPAVSGQKGVPTFDLRTDPPMKEFQFRLNRFSQGISDFSPMFKRIGNTFKQMEVKQFQSEGALGAGRWAKLSEDYAKWKQLNYPGRKIGVLTGALRASLTGGHGYSEHVTKTSASFGMDDSAQASAYAKYFAGGWTSSAGNQIPARPVIVATALRGTQMRRTVDIWVREEAHHAGLIGAGSQKYQQALPDESAYLPST